MNRNPNLTSPRLTTTATPDSDEAWYNSNCEYVSCGKGCNEWQCSVDCDQQHCNYATQCNYENACPTSAPTSSPTPLPSPTPTSAPTGGTRTSIDLTIGLNGMSCDAYGSEEEAVVNDALASVISGVSSDSFSEHVCTPAGSRRALQATSITISTTAAVDTAQVTPTVLLDFLKT